MNSKITKSEFRVMGIMSGTSLDGIDLAICTFRHQNKKWNFTIEKAITLEYSDNWKNKLSGASNLNSLELLKLHNEYGEYIGQSVKTFIAETGLIPELIASHGHTIFHQPSKGITFQLGHGAAIAATCGRTTISDFRSFDVALGGQGAPLVPVGDKLLFQNYQFCLNLGGFANISFDKNNNRVAFDICPVNIVLNHLVKPLKLSFDTEGKLARNGSVNGNLLEKLNTLTYYSKTGPKSLGREWLVKDFLPVLDQFEIPVKDKLRTVTEHIADQINKSTSHENMGNILITGGGVFNTFLVETIRIKNKHNLIQPDKLLINYKEALIFAFIGLLRYLGQPNVYASVTGAGKDSVSGIIFEYI
ncbi:MAG: anhydro-N-acetylmuramic acid kinase [Bacteroidales bacterium]|nr:anhydro-N-acetylmuramic acid kinase [Bacteroidales bacterium]